MARQAQVTRNTNETQISVTLNLDGSGKSKLATGVGFLDHMLNAFARYSGLALDVKASSDLKHHLVEDVALTIGRAFKEIIPAGAARYGNRVVPMDDALVQVSVDMRTRTTRAPYPVVCTITGCARSATRRARPFTSWYFAEAIGITWSRPPSRRSDSRCATLSPIPERP